MFTVISSGIALDPKVRKLKQRANSIFFFSWWSTGISFHLQLLKNTSMTALSDQRKLLRCMITWALTVMTSTYYLFCQKTKYCCTWDERNSTVCKVYVLCLIRLSNYYRKFIIQWLKVEFNIVKMLHLLYSMYRPTVISRNSFTVY